MGQRKGKSQSGAAAAPPPANAGDAPKPPAAAQKPASDSKERPPLTPEQRKLLSQIKARETRWQWVKTLLYFPVILIFWQCPLYTWTPEHPVPKKDRVPIQTSAAQRACYEILGPLSMLHVNPPGMVATMCSTLLPVPFSKEIAQQASSIVRLNDQITGNLKYAQRHGLVKFTTQLTLPDWLDFAESANWIRLLPSLLIFAPQGRHGVFNFVLTSVVFGRPAATEALTKWAWILLAFCLLDWYISVRRWVWRAPFRTFFFYEGVELVSNQVLPVFCAFCLVCLMLGFATAFGLEV